MGSRGAYPDDIEHLAELVSLCVEQAARDGFALIINDATPVVPAPTFPFELYTPHLSERGVWADIAALARAWAAVGCRWVNLRFTLDVSGAALVYYEAKPDGEPLPDGRLPVFNGGFDAPR